MSMMNLHENRRRVPRLDMTNLQDRVLPVATGMLAVLTILAAAYLAAPDNPQARQDAEQIVPLRALHGGSLR